MGLKLWLTGVAFICGLLAVPLLLVLPLEWAMDGHGAPLVVVEQIEEGMSDAEVLEILGYPDSVYEGPDGNTYWTYGRFLTWCYCGVVFLPDGHVAEIIHDH